MLASAFAPILLNPVGYEALSCTGSSLILRFRPSPCPSHYAGHLATIPSADFCLITDRVTPVSAIGLYLLRSPKAIHPLEPRHLLTRALLVIYRSLVKQISPDKSMNCPCAKLPHPAHAPYLHPCRQLHHLRWPLDHMASSSWTQSASRGRLCQLASSLRLI